MKFNYRWILIMSLSRADPLRYGGIQLSNCMRYCVSPNTLPTDARELQLTQPRMLVWSIFTCC
jgi:hypothetical protein